MCIRARTVWVCGSYTYLAIVTLITRSRKRRRNTRNHSERTWVGLLRSPFWFFSFLAYPVSCKYSHFLRRWVEVCFRFRSLSRKTILYLSRAHLRALMIHSTAYTGWRLVFVVFFNHENLTMDSTCIIIHYLTHKILQWTTTLTATNNYLLEECRTLGGEPEWSACACRRTCMEQLHSHDCDRAMSIGHRNYGTKHTLVYITATVSQVSYSVCSWSNLAPTSPAMAPW